MKRPFTWLSRRGAIGVCSVALLIALLAFFLAPVGVSIDAGGFLSVGVQKAYAAPDYPAIESVTGGDDSGTSHTVNMPSGVESGDLLVVIFSTTEDAPPIIEITFPEGWTEFYEEAQDYLRGGCAYKVADGEEGSSIEVATSEWCYSAHNSYRVSGFSGTPEAGTPATGEGTTPDPPSLTPTWGAKDTLWLVVLHYYSTDVISSYPTNYTNGMDYNVTPSGVLGCGSARRELNASSENPGTFTMAAWSRWIANTIAIQPVACSEDITNTPSAWSVNAGSPVDANSNYSTGLTFFEVTNNSGGAVDIAISGTDMTGGGYTWTLSDTATPGDMTYGLKAGLDGGDYTIIVKKTSPYNTLVSGLADEGTQDWGLKLYTPTSYDDGNSKSGTVTVIATCN